MIELIKQAFRLINRLMDAITASLKRKHHAERQAQRDTLDGDRPVDYFSSEFGGVCDDRDEHEQSADEADSGRKRQSRE